ncbi:MAG: RDD family protein, partial [Planctomycetota bacterium]|nr:RDD family protein [Planctomycetota bacterium]
AVISTFALHGAYCLIMELQFGATLGKRLVGLRVVSVGGRKPQAYEVLYRTVLRVLELGTLVGLAMAIGGMLLTRYRQRIGDLLAQTAVVESSPILLPPPPPAGPPPVEPPPLPPPRPDNDRPANGPN